MKYELKNTKEVALMKSLSLRLKIFGGVCLLASAAVYIGNSFLGENEQVLTQIDAHELPGSLEKHEMSPLVSTYASPGLARVNQAEVMSSIYQEFYSDSQENFIKKLSKNSSFQLRDTLNLLERISVDSNDEGALRLLEAKQVEFRVLKDEAIRWVDENDMPPKVKLELGERFSLIENNLKRVIEDPSSDVVLSASVYLTSLDKNPATVSHEPIFNVRDFSSIRKELPTLNDVLVPTQDIKLPNYMKPTSEASSAIQSEFSHLAEEYLLSPFLGKKAFASLTPVSAASACNYQQSDISSALPEIDLSDARISSLAESLKYSPVKIYEYVRNNIIYEPTSGSIKGAVGTLETGSGNAIDQSSLLVALLRSSGIPARYVNSTVDLNFTDPAVHNWVGVKSKGAAVKRFVANQHVIYQTDDEDVFSVPHVYVEACVPYDNYRGAKSNNSGYKWIPIDAAYKEHRFVVEDVASQSFNFDYESYLSVRSDVSVEEALADQLEAHIGKALDKDLGVREVVKKKIEILPSSLPYEKSQVFNWNTDVGSSVAAIPDSHRAFVEIELSNSGSVLLTPMLRLDMPSLVAKRLTLGFDGATAAEQQLLDQWIQDGGVLPCSINVSPKFRLNGEDITPAGTVTPSGLCETGHVLNVNIYLTNVIDINEGPGLGVIDAENPTITTTMERVPSANLFALQIHANTVAEKFVSVASDRILSEINAEPDLLPRNESFLGEYLHIVGMRHELLQKNARQKIASSFNAVAEEVCEIGSVQAARDINYLFDIPLGVSAGSLFIDLPGLASTSIDVNDGSISSKAAQLSGYASSFYESYVWQEHANLDAISTVRGLQYLNEIGAVLHSIQSLSDIDNKLNQSCASGFSYSQNQLNRMRAFLSPDFSNVEIIAPTCQFSYHDWKGIVWLAEYVEVSTERPGGSFIIDGDIVASGGSTVNTYLEITNDPTSGLNIGYTNVLPPPLAELINTTSDSGQPNTPSQTPEPTPSSFAGTNTGNDPDLSTVQGDPVNMVSGNMYHTETDFALKGRGGLPIVFQRYYNSNNRADSPLGFGWTHSLNHHLRFYDQDGNGSTDKVAWVNGTGGISVYSFTDINSFNYTPSPGLYVAAGREPNGEYSVREKNGFRYYFESVAGTHEQRANLLRVEDRRGNTLSLTYDAAGRLDTVSDDLGRVVDFQYDGASTHIARIVDWDNRVFRYTYADDNLIKYESPEAVAGNKAAMTYNYYTATDGTNLDHAMKSFTKPNGNSMTFEYYTNGRVFRHINSEGKAYNFRYNPFRRESTTIDERGVSETFLFNDKGLPVEHTLGDGTRMRYEYTDARHPLSETARINELGYRTESFYDDDANLVRMRMPDGSEIQYLDYNQFHQPGRIIDQRGNTTLYKYDSEGNRTQTIALKQGVTTSAPNAGQVIAWMLNSYDDHGNLLKSKTARDFAQVSQNAAFDSVPGPYMEYVYGANALHPEEVRRCGLQHSAAGTLENRCVSAAQTFDVLGRPLQAANAALYTGEMRYDDDDRVVQMTNGIRRWQDLSYDDNDNLIASSLQGKNSLGEVSLLAFASAEYDSLDRPVRKGNLAGHASDMLYDPVGNLLKMTDPDGYTVSFEYDQRNRPLKAFDKQGNAVSTRYDNAGRPLEVTDPNGNTRRMVYYGTSENGRLQSSTLPDNRSLTYFYDDNGNVIRTVDNGNRESLMQYDALDRVVRSVGPLHDGVEGLNIRAVMTYQYNELGQQTTIYAGYTNAAADPASDSLQLQASYSYDDFGRQIGMTDALGETTQAFYDDYGNPVKQIKPNGHIVEMTYDHARNGLLIQRTARLNATDPNPIVTFWKHDDLGRVIEVDDTFADYQYEYDRAGNLVKVSDLRGDKTLFYSFSPGKLLNEISDSDGRSRQYLYDAVGRMSTVRTNSGIRANFSYDAGGRLEERQVFRTPGRGIRTRYKYDSADKLLSVVNRTVSLNGTFTTYSRHTYQYDNLGRKTQADQKIVDFDAQGDFFLRDWDFSYQYDALNRLIDVQRNGALDEAFTYDVYDNRRSRQTTTANTQYSYDPAHQLNEAVTTESGVSNSILYRYDEAGNLLKRCGGTIASQSATDCSGSDELVLGYDALDRTVQSQRTGETTQNYIYSYDGNRIELQEGSTKRRYVYDGLDIWSEFGSDWQAEALAHMTYAGLDMPLLREDYEDGRDYHYLPDGMGSIAARMYFNANNPNTPKIARYFYDAWGNPDSLSNSSAPRFGYTGREHDSHGLIYSRARFYDPAIGRFNQRDPMGFIDGVNQYAYVGMSPTNFTDPLGLAKVEPGFVQQSQEIATYYKEQIFPNATALGKRGRSGTWTEELLGGVQALGNMVIEFNNATLPYNPFAYLLDTKPMATMEIADTGLRTATAVETGSFLFGVGAIRGVFVGSVRASVPVSQTLRARHHTNSSGLSGIKDAQAINASRGQPYGVDVEVEPFGNVLPGRGGPKGDLGSAGEGAYVEFDLPGNAVSTYGIGPRNTARIPTGGPSTPLSLEGLNPKFVSVPWWKFW